MSAADWLAIGVVAAVVVVGTLAAATLTNAHTHNADGSIDRALGWAWSVVLGIVFVGLIIWRLPR